MPTSNTPSSRKTVSGQESTSSNSIGYTTTAKVEKDAIANGCGVVASEDRIDHLGAVHFKNLERSFASSTIWMVFADLGEGLGLGVPGDPQTSMNDAYDEYLECLENWGNARVIRQEFDEHGMPESFHDVTEVMEQKRQRVLAARGLEDQHALWADQFENGSYAIAAIAAE